MNKSIMDFFNSDLQFIRGVGPVLAEKLSELLDGRRVLDFLLQPPRAVLRRNMIDSVVNATAGDTVTILVRVANHNRGGIRYNRYGKRINLPAQITCFDKFNAELKIRFFNTKFFDYWAAKLPVGSWRLVSGKMENGNDGAFISHPDFIEVPEDSEKIPELQVLYPLTEGITQKMMANVRDQIFAKLKAIVGANHYSPDTNSEQPTAHSEFIDALRDVHYPHGEEDIDPSAPARARLAYCELFAHQVAIARAREVRKKYNGIMRDAARGCPTPLAGGGPACFVIPAKAGTWRGVPIGLQKKLLENLPFKLTEAQSRALDEINSDMQKPLPMMRLVQGDVGSGKTIVALAAMLSAADSGTQSVLLAPTDTLARQHFSKIKPMCDELGIVCEMLTGRDKGAPRHEKLVSIKSGRAKIIIGTHAVFSADVEYKNLGLAVIDEQHRFGVEQRAAIAAKGAFVDVLAMSATPIPRTLSMTMYGDMDISIIDQKPAGRLPIKTTKLPATRIPALIERIKNLLAADVSAFAGMTNQRLATEKPKVFWVCPLVDATAASDFMSAETRYESLRATFGDAVGMVHGKMKKEARDKVMEEFADPNSKMKILVSTTVIEVGIDVPQASIMVIESAEKFWLSALHQLRGRVGRGSAQSFCMLVFGSKLTIEGAQRLDVLVHTDDGFKIAEQDLMMRGVGELLGTKQSGWIDYVFVDFRAHQSLFKLAARDARELVETDPTLSSDKGQFARDMMSVFDREVKINN